jgi:hypothetical protein
MSSFQDDLLKLRVEEFKAGNIAPSESDQGDFVQVQGFCREFCRERCREFCREFCRERCREFCREFCRERCREFCRERCRAF